MKLINMFVVAALATACGGSESGGAIEPTPPTTEADRAAATSATTATLGVGDITILFEGNAAIKVDANGAITANMGGEWKEVGMIKDGQIIAEGKTMASVADGVLTFSERPDAKIQLSGGTVSWGPSTIAIGDDGVVTGMNPEAEGKIRVEGATDEATKYTALTMILGVMMMGKEESSASEAPVMEKTEAAPPN